MGARTHECGVVGCTNQKKHSVRFNNVQISVCEGCHDLAFSLAVQFERDLLDSVEKTLASVRHLKGGSRNEDSD